jgi:hypothetical protein
MSVRVIDLTVTGYRGNDGLARALAALPHGGQIVVEVSASTYRVFTGGFGRVRPVAPPKDAVERYRERTSR